MAQRAGGHDLHARLFTGKGVVKALAVIIEKLLHLRADLAFAPAGEMAQNAAIDQRCAQYLAGNLIEAHVRLDGTSRAAALHLRTEAHGVHDGLRALLADGGRGDGRPDPAAQDGGAEEVEQTAGGRLGMDSDAALRRKEDERVHGDAVAVLRGEAQSVLQCRCSLFLICARLAQPTGIGRHAGDA